MKPPLSTTNLLLSHCGIPSPCVSTANGLVGIPRDFAIYLYIYLSISPFLPHLFILGVSLPICGSSQDGKCNTAPHPRCRRFKGKADQGPDIYLWGQEKQVGVSDPFYLPTPLQGFSG